MKLVQRFPCPCCCFVGLDEEPPGTFEICVLCGWEDDPVQLDEPTVAGGANRLSLVEWRRQFEERIAGESPLRHHFHAPAERQARALAERLSGLLDSLEVFRTYRGYRGWQVTGQAPLQRDLAERLREQWMLRSQAGEAGAVYAGPGLPGWLTFPHG
jgi:hypothetical protein